MKSKLLIAGIFAAALLLFSALVFSGSGNSSEFLEKRAALVVRKIGHHLLLEAGDSSSRILPVTRMSPAVFQLEFENPFSFMPDTLVRIVETNLASLGLPLSYMVNVLNCHSKQMVYGFEMRHEQADLIPCLGRGQPSGCYAIQIAFIDLHALDGSDHKSFLSFAIWGILAILAYAGMAFLINKKRVIAVGADHTVSMSKYIFNEDQGVLKYDSATIELSSKETKLLGMFATRQNQLIRRDRLLKEVWEDEGVFTGRSLDMFISRLRKKLRDDPTIRLINIHGKGYKLEVNK